jgi:hypothetical protein
MLTSSLKEMITERPGDIIRVLLRPKKITGGALSVQCVFGSPKNVLYLQHE